MHGDGRVLARGRRDHERVKELVVTEDSGDRVGPASGIDDRSARVEDASDRE